MLVCENLKWGWVGLHVSLENVILFPNLVLICQKFIGQFSALLPHQHTWKNTFSTVFRFLLLFQCSLTCLSIHVLRCRVPRFVYENLLKILYLNQLKIFSFFSPLVSLSFCSIFKCTLDLAPSFSSVLVFHHYTSAPPCHHSTTFDMNHLTTSERTSFNIEFSTSTSLSVEFSMEKTGLPDSTIPSCST